MNNDEIQEEQPLLLEDPNHGMQVKKTYSLNTGLAPSANNLGDKVLEMESPKVQKSMTMAARGMSLATRANIDPMELVAMAKEKCKQPIKLTWDDVVFDAVVTTTPADRAADPRLGTTKTLNIVKKVSGYAPPGQATFIMGSSGAGKTSLLNILADRISSATETTLSGNILFNDEVPVNKESFQKYAAYVMQDDVLFATFTVREALTFAARLKLKINEAEQDSLVSDLIMKLGMSHISESTIGDQQRKVLSGGERKRVSIGVELVSDPSVVLLDEPTSGLDSFKALSICRLLNQLAREGKTIVSTIHSPGSDAFYYFDRLILMCDGNIVYQGDAKASAAYFNSIKRPVPPFTNPADFFMRLLSINYPKKQADEELLEYLNRNYHMFQEKSVKAEQRMIRLDAPITTGADAINHKAPMGVQFSQLMSRSWTLAKREPRLSRAKIFQSILIGLLMMGAFWQVNDYSSAVEVANMAGAIYYMTIVQVQLNFQPTVIIFQGEKPIYVRERDSGMYDIWVYATTKVIAEIPISMVTPFVFLCTIYFAIGLTDAATNFFGCYLVISLMIQAATAMGYALSSMFNHETSAIAFAPIMIMPINLLGGYMINLVDIFQQRPQRGIVWLMYLSPVRYGFQAMMNVQFPVVDPNSQEEILDEATQVMVKNTYYPYYPQTVEIMEYYGFNDKSFWGSIGMLIVLFLTFRSLVILSLWCQDRKRGGSSNDTRNTNIPARRQPTIKQQ